MGEVVIVEYRTPNIQDELKSQKKKITSLNNQLAYLQMISGVETEVDHELDFEKVKSFYITELWSLNWVWNAVGKWLTADEYHGITGKDYKTKREI